MSAPGLTPRDQGRLENLRREYHLAPNPRARGDITRDAYLLLLRAGIGVDAAIEIVEARFLRTSRRSEA